MWVRDWNKHHRTGWKLHYISPQTQYTSLKHNASKPSGAIRKITLTQHIPKQDNSKKEKEISKDDSHVDKKQQSAQGDSDPSNKNNEPLKEKVRWITSSWELYTDNTWCLPSLRKIPYLYISYPKDQLCHDRHLNLLSQNQSGEALGAGWSSTSFTLYILQFQWSKIGWRSKFWNITNVQSVWKTFRRLDSVEL